MATPSLASLASTIAEKTSSLSRLLEAQQVAQPSFAEDSYKAYVGENSAVRQARYDLAGAAQDLVRLAQGPEDQILQTAWQSTDVSNLAVLVHFGIPQSVPLGSSTTGAEVATKVGLPEDIVVRTLRYAIGIGFFVEEAVGVFKHNAASARLAHSETLRDIVNISTHELTRIVTSLSDTIEAQKKAKEVGGEGPAAAVNVAFPGYSSVFDFLSKSPAVAKRYHLYMAGRAKTDRWSAANVIKSWDWASVGSKTIVDIGGSMGHTCIALQKACPEAKFVVQDVDPVALGKGQETMSAFPELASRVSWVQYDFFQPQHVTADIYLFRHIFHDWNDLNVIKILKNMVSGLKAGSRLLVIEGVMPKPPAKKAQTIDQKHILVEDMFMLGAHGSRERNVDEYINLFKEADHRFKFVGISGGSDGAFQSIVDFKFED